MVHRLYVFLGIMLICGPATVSRAQQSPSPVTTELPVQDDKLTDGQLQDFQALTRQKVNEFQRYLAVIADPGQPGPIRELAIENARLLFLPDAVMQVGSATTRQVRAYPLAIYLRRLRNLDRQYVAVTITFYDLALVGDWEKASAGYTTTATYFQHFRGRGANGKMIYNARTSKHITVDLRHRNDPFYEENRWTVLLGDVRLAERQPNRPRPL